MREQCQNWHINLSATLTNLGLFPTTNNPGFYPTGKNDSPTCFTLSQYQPAHIFMMTTKQPSFSAESTMKKLYLGSPSQETCYLPVLTSDFWLMLQTLLFCARADTLANSISASRTLATPHLAN